MHYFIVNNIHCEMITVNPVDKFHYIVVSQSTKSNIHTKFVINHGSHDVYSSLFTIIPLYSSLTLMYQIANLKDISLEIGWLITATHIDIS